MRLNLENEGNILGKQCAGIYPALACWGRTAPNPLQIPSRTTGFLSRLWRLLCKRQIKERIDKGEKIVVERNEKFRYYFLWGERMTTNKLKHQVRLQEWTELVRECRGSGKSVRHWCEEHGISKYTYYRWEREILGIAAKHSTVIASKESEMIFAELPAPQQPYRHGMECFATLRVGGMSIDIYEGASAEFLRTILTAIQSC